MKQSFKYKKLINNKELTKKQEKEIVMSYTLIKLFQNAFPFNSDFTAPWEESDELFKLIESE
jgi:hypothetical protein